MVFNKKYCVLLSIVLLQVLILEGSERRSWLVTRLMRTPKTPKTEKVSKTEKKMGYKDLT